MDPSGASITSLHLVISGAEVVLGPGEHILGRSAECSVCIEDPLASRRHAAITVESGRVTIRDLGSRNGVLVNGDDIDQDRVLVEGDLITLGSLVLAVRQICRAGRESARPASMSGSHASSSPPGKQVIKAAPLAKIAVQKRVVPDPARHAAADAEHLADLRSTTLSLNTLSPIGRPAAAFRLIAEAAMRAISSNRADRAERILEAPLTEVLSTLRAGIDVEDEVIEIARQQALILCDITGEMRWVDYLHELHDALRVPMPLAVADRLALFVQRGR